MSWFLRMIQRYDTAIWIRVIGTIMATFAGFMIRPFLALYLYNKLDENLIIAALVVGLQPATSIVSSIFAGGLADRYGRKPLMVIALLVESISMLGYVWAESLVSFALLTILNGIGASLFWPAASAQVADVVPEEKRSEVFALLHTALNIGAAMGPLCGVAIYAINPSIAFVFSSLALFLYSLLVFFKIPETLPKELRHKVGTTGSVEKVVQPKLTLKEHTPLFFITLAMIPVSLLYSQVEIVLPQHLKSNFSDFLTVFATLMTINGAIVVSCQILLAKFADRFPIHKVIFTAYLFFALTCIGYGWSKSFLFLILAELMFTIGEMLNGPQIQKAISIMAPPEYRGRYFSIFSSHWGITGTFGPALGAFAFTNIGGNYWFTIIAFLLIFAGIIQFGLVRRASQSMIKTQSTAPSTSIETSAVVS